MKRIGQSPTESACNAEIALARLARGIAHDLRINREAIEHDRAKLCISRRAVEDEPRAEPLGERASRSILEELISEPAVPARLP